ncbi:response regulator transcription factor [Paenibacillus massiliensis]|uniref:response regulator transcription factor n=1 Tax=Paenibacillus massiliensis TaxID=225917 RepID=UPI000380BB5E|nr:LuxR C-terminal-related transcriptional regulator [Paenibacillus massiliensis]
MPVTKLSLTVASSAGNEREREELAELHSIIMNWVIQMNIRDCIQVKMEYEAVDQEALPVAATTRNPQSTGPAESVVLSGRQLEIAELLCRHYSIRRIAEELYISVNTVKKHIQNIKKTLCIEQTGGDFVFLLAEKLKSHSRTQD